MTCKIIIKWGILGTGKIAHDFITCLNFLNNSVRMVGASTTERANVFAKEHNVLLSGSYNEVATHDDIDVVYIGTRHHQHKEHILMCLREKKHVLCEKPIALCANDVIMLYKVAEENGVCLIEGLWTAFFPVINQLQRQLHKIGEIKNVKASFSIHEFDRLFDADSGGVTYEIGIYPLFLISLVCNIDDDDDDDWLIRKECKNNVDVSCGVFKEGIQATWSVETNCEDMFYITGTNGCIYIENNAHAPTTLWIEKDNYENVERYQYPLPDIKDSTLNYVNSAGLCYEIEAVHEYINNTKTPNQYIELHKLMERVKLCK